MVDFSKWVKPTVQPNLVDASRVGLEGVRQFGEGMRFDRAQTERERAQAAQEELAKESQVIQRERMAQKAADNEAWRDLQESMQQRGIEAREAQFGREQEALQAQQVQAMQGELMALSQSPDPNDQRKANVLTAMLGSMGWDVEQVGMEAQPAQTPFASQRGALPPEGLPAAPPAPPAAAAPTPSALPAERDPNLYSPLFGDLGGAPPPPAAPPTPLPDVGPQPAAPAGFAPGALPGVAAPPPPAELPLTPTAEAGPEFVPPAAPVPAAAPGMPPQPVPVISPPTEPGMRFVNRNTGETFFAGLEPPTVRPHPEDELHDYIDQYMVSPPLNRSWHAAAQMVHESYGESVTDLPDQLKLTAQIAGQLNDDEINYLNMKYQQRKRAGGRPKGSGMSESEILSTWRFTFSESEKLLKENGFFEGKEAISQTGTIIKMLNSGSVQQVDAAATMLATSLQSGVLSNQDKKAYQELPGIMGSVETWIARNRGLVGERGEVPLELRQELVKTVERMQDAARVKVGVAYEAIETEYMDLNRRLTAAAMAGDTELSNVLRIRRNELGGTIKKHVHKSYWNDLPGLGNSAANAPSKQAKDITLNELLGD